MNIKASGRSALIIAAGFCVGILGPFGVSGRTANAAPAVRESDAGAKAAGPIVLKKFAKQRVRHASKAKTQKRRFAGLRANGAPAAVKQATTESPTTPDDEPAKVVATDAEMPASVSNAYAQLAATDVPPASDASETTTGAALNATKQDKAALPIPQAPPAQPEVVSSDQLNELDLAAAEEKPQQVSEAKVQQLAAPSGSDNDAWSSTSLIGKIFIAFGGILTLASAARMFMA